MNGNELAPNLYQHQLESIDQMEKLEQTKFVQVNGSLTLKTNLGINCNISGSGKTLAMAKLIERNRAEWNIDKPMIVESVETFCENNISTITVQQYIRNNISLIVCNPWIVNQWEKELNRCRLKYITITKNKTIQTIDKNTEVIIIVPTMLAKLLQNYYKIAWKRIIFDEPVSLKIPPAEFKAGFIWLITCNPKDICNQRYNNKASTLDRILCSRRFNNYYEYLQVKTNSEQIKTIIALPTPETIFYTCVSNYKCNRGIITEYIRSLIDQNNIDKAIKLLGGIKTDDIFTAVKNKKELQLRELKSSLSLAELQDRVDKIEQYRVEINNKNRELDHIEERIRTKLEQPCSICHDTINNPILEFNCCNIFCGCCCLNWLCNQKVCPICKTKISFNQLYHFNSTEQEEEKSPLPNKDDLLLQIIRQSGRKCVLYCLMNYLFAVEHLLKNNNIPFIELGGKSDNYTERLNRCKQGKAILILDDKTNYIGLNLDWATDIIFYDYNIKQADTNYLIERANIFGRESKLVVHNLVSME